MDGAAPEGRSAPVSLDGAAALPDMTAYVRREGDLSRLACMVDGIHCGGCVAIRSSPPSPISSITRRATELAEVEIATHAPSAQR